MTGADAEGPPLDILAEPLLDRAFLDAQTFGDAALAAELLGLFDAQCRRLAPRLADAAVPPAERADAAHTLKGAARAIGARRVAALAALVEEALAAPQEASRLSALASALADAAAATPAAAA